MKTVEYKVGTRQEIIDYFKLKSKGIFKGFPNTLQPGDWFELDTYLVESQIDEVMASGSPLVVVSVCKKQANGFFGYHRESFVVEDFADHKLDMEIRRFDRREDIQRKFDQFLEKLPQSPK